MTNEGPRPVEAIDRAVLILKELGDAGPTGLMLADLSTRLGCSKATVYRALTTLRGRAFAEQDPVTGRYSLGPGALGLGDTFFERGRLGVLLHPALVALSTEVGELTHLGVLIGSQVMYLDKVEPERAIRVYSRIGEGIPAVRAAMGRALLAWRGLSEDQLAPFMSGSEVVRGTVYEPLRLEHVWSALVEARTRGYAVERGEVESQITCMGIPLQRNGQTVAAVSITAMKEVMTDSRMDSFYRVAVQTLTPLLPEGFSIPTP